jgi:cyclase
MLKKRLIGVVTVKNGWAVQSFGYRRYLPLGRPECMVENLDRWGADEILVQVIDRSVRGLGPDFDLLDRLARLGLGTPLIYGGGIRSVDEGVEAIQRGADRIVLDAVLNDAPDVMRALGIRLGAQALIAALPTSMAEGGLAKLDYRNGTSVPVSQVLGASEIREVISEVLVIDWQHEGVPGGFDDALVRHFPFPDVALIAFGGISEAQQMKNLLARPNVAAVAVGNFLSYREHAIQKIRDELASSSLRTASFATEYSLRSDV